MMVVMGVGLTGNAEIKNTRNIWIWYITGNNNYHPGERSPHENNPDTGDPGNGGSWMMKWVMTTKVLLSGAGKEIQCPFCKAYTPPY